MQGWPEIIPTQVKIDYLNALMSVGFDVLDCGSFVSPKAIPQMQDTEEVLAGIDKSLAPTQLSVIVANVSGAEKAVAHPAVDILGFPFSISETFQQRNTNKSREEAFEQILQIQRLCAENGKVLRVYFSMAFGNPYGEPWSVDHVAAWAERFQAAGIRHILLSDTTGVAGEAEIRTLFSALPSRFPEMLFAAHFHNRYEESYAKLKAAYDEGCRHFDSAIRGIGGCPMAKDELVGNMPTEQVFNFLHAHKIPVRQNMLHFESAWNRAKDIFHF